MFASASPTVIRAQLPTPDMVIVTVPDGSALLVVDDRLPQQFVDRAILDLSVIASGTPYPLGELPTA